MPLVTRLIDAITVGSDHPMRRLLAYYTILAGLGALSLWLFPAFARVLYNDITQAVPDAPFLLQDGLSSAATEVSGAGPSGLTSLLLTAVALGSSLLLMLPVSWVYMSARQVRGHSQAIVQTLIILPIVVAGIVFVVRNSLALAFSLAGVVAAVRFRTTLRDARDVVFIFLAIGVGFAAGVYMLGIGFLVSMFFNFVVLLTWRYGFGRSALAPTAAAQWKDPLSSLASSSDQHKVPDREILLALTPDKVSALAERFQRVQHVQGNGKGNGKHKQRFNAVISIATGNVTEAQAVVQRVLENTTKRWALDEVVTNTGKPSEMYYLVRLPKKVTRDELITAVRAEAGSLVTSVEVEMAVGVEQEEDAA
ncbi:MAG: DUF4956 domain-containing protein [Gemmatimonadaceae bacterium]